MPPCSFCKGKRTCFSSLSTGAGTFVDPKTPCPLCGVEEIAKPKHNVISFFVVRGTEDLRHSIPGKGQTNVTTSKSPNKFTDRLRENADQARSRALVGLRTGAALDFCLGTLAGIASLWFWDGPKGIAWSCGVASFWLFLHGWNAHQTLKELQK